MCRPDPDQLLVRLSARDMSLDASDLNVSSFSRALSSFHKTKQKVGSSDVMIYMTFLLHFQKFKVKFSPLKVFGFEVDDIT